MRRVLIVDDERGMRTLLAELVGEMGHPVVQAEGVKAAIEALSHDTFGLVITDQRMPDGSGMDVLSAVKARQPETPVVLLTAHGTIELAVSAMRAGAFDFITKPFEEETVRAVVTRALERARLVRENELLRTELHRSAGGELIGQSPPMLALKESIARAGPTDAAILVLGETGAGKELVAREIHRCSLRSSRPFVPINCAAVPETLLESVLFGHEKNAFTGAAAAKSGLFEAADEGTVFLDEIGEMSPSLQAKLLRVLNDGEILRVGSNEPRKVNVRVIAATHRDVDAEMRAGRFREDLYFRLAVIPLRVPPLRERGGDIELLSHALLDRAALELKTERPRLLPETIARMGAYAWPGNVRELRNVIERACILGGPEITPADLRLGESPVGAPNSAPQDPLGVWIEALGDTFDLKAALAEVESRLLRAALAHAGGVRAEAARRIGISRSDMTYKLRHKGEPGGA